MKSRACKAGFKLEERDGVSSSEVFAQAGRTEADKGERAELRSCAVRQLWRQRRVKVVLGNLPFLGPARAKSVLGPTPVSGAGTPGPTDPKKEYFLRSTLTRLESRALGDDFR